MRYWLLRYFGGNQQTVAMESAPFRSFEAAAARKRERMERAKPDAFGNIIDPYVIVMAGPAGSITMSPQDLDTHEARVRREALEEAADVLACWSGGCDLDSGDVEAMQAAIRKLAET